MERSAEIARGVLLLRTINDAFVPPFRVEKLYGSESFQHSHWSMATRASPKCGLRLCRSLLRHRREKVATDRKQFVPSAIGQPAEVANAWKPFRQDVLQEAVQKFLAGQRHGALLVVVGVIFPSEDHLGFVDRENAVVGNGYAVRVTGQIMQYVLGSAKRWLGVNDPIFLEQGVQECCKGIFVGQRQALSVKCQLLGAESASQSGNEFSTKDTAKDEDRQEEVDWCREPALVIG